MKKYKVNGADMVKVSSVNYGIRKIRKYINDSIEDINVKKGMERSLNLFLRYLYRDELDSCETEEERKDILETTGDFILYRYNPCNNEAEGFLRWEDGKAVIGSINDCMVFRYESVANSVRDKLCETSGDGWEVVDNCEDSLYDSVRLLKAIFGE